MKWSLPTLKSEVSALEVATIATTVSLGVSVVFNLGFFWDTEPSLISLLTIQDYAIGAIVGILPILAPVAPFVPGRARHGTGRPRGCSARGR